MEQKDLMEKLVSLAKRRGFIYQGSEIYGGLAGTWDFGPLGVALKNNIKNSWRKTFVGNREDMYEVDAALLMNPKVWETSGHVGGFADPMVECPECKQRFRADHIETKDDGFQYCPNDNNVLSAPRQFNMMFQTQVGAMEDSASTVYFRPETAQGMFVNFKNIVDSFAPKLPCEFEQMEIEYFIKSPKTDAEWQEAFEKLRTEMLTWMQEIGLDMTKVHELKVEGADLAHYSKATTDFEFDFPFGRKELYGLAYRTDFDLKAHSEASGVKLEYFDFKDFDEVESATAFFGTRREKRWVSLLEVEFKRHADFLYRKSGKIITYSPQTSPGEARKEAIKSYTHLGVNEKGKLCHPLIDQRYKT